MQIIWEKKGKWQTKTYNAIQETFVGREERIDIIKSMFKLYNSLYRWPIWSHKNKKNLVRRIKTLFTKITATKSVRRDWEKKTGVWRNRQTFCLKTKNLCVLKSKSLYVKLCYCFSLLFRKFKIDDNYKNKDELFKSMWNCFSIIIIIIISISRNKKEYHKHYKLDVFLPWNVESHLISSNFISSWNNLLISKIISDDLNI